MKDKEGLTMSTWIESISEGLRIYVNYGIPVTLPIMIIIMIVSKRFNPVELAVKQMFVLYLCCVVELVFFPLPMIEEASGLSIQYQLIPMHFISDFMNDSFFRVLRQVVFNVIMTIPFGMFLEYCIGLDIKRALLVSFSFTAFIEIGQLTGLFFVFNGSYRLFDVDDLMLNTLGALIGYLAIRRAENSLIPTIDRFDLIADSYDLISELHI